jgi:hypothetical protein
MDALLKEMCFEQTQFLITKDSKKLYMTTFTFGVMSTVLRFGRNSGHESQVAFCGKNHVNGLFCVIIWSILFRILNSYFIDQRPIKKRHKKAPDFSSSLKTIIWTCYNRQIAHFKC